MELAGEANEVGEISVVLFDGLRDRPLSDNRCEEQGTRLLMGATLEDVLSERWRRERSSKGSASWS